MSRILLTGANGFIGRCALAFLQRRGHEIYAVGRTPGPPLDGVSWHPVDLLDQMAMARAVRTAGASHLLHLAWYAVPGLFWTAPENERWVDASLGLLDAFATAGGRRAVLAGSCAEYLWDNELLDERQSAIAPATLYGRCKDDTRRAAVQLADQRRLSLAWGRIFFVYGPREQPSRLVASVARGLLSGERVPTTDGSQVRDFLHVDDVAAAFVRLLESDVIGPVNIASGEPSTVKEVISRVAAAAGGLDRVEFGSLPRQPGDPQRILGNATRLIEEVGFRPAIALADGIASTVDWWRTAIAEAGR